MSIKPGQNLSHYRLLHKIGEGGMGIVYKARDERLHRHVALKVLPPDRVRDPVYRRRLLREARAAAAVTHPNIATIFEADEVGDQIFIVMELIEGRTLRSLLDGRPMSLSETLHLASQIADALAGAHQAGFVHRDLKPENIMVGSDRHVKILDFGLAKPLDAMVGGDTHRLSSMTTASTAITAGKMILGTFAYMSPEQACGDRVDPRSDVFSFGIMLFEMLTGRRPFGGAGTAGLLGAIMHDPPLSAATLNPSLPREVLLILDKCLAKRLEERYQGARDLAVDLRRGLAASEGRLTGAARAPRLEPGRTSSGTRDLLSAAARFLAHLAPKHSVARSAALLHEGDAIVVSEFEDHANEPGLATAVRDVFEHLLARSPRLDVVRESQWGGTPGAEGNGGVLSASGAAELCARKGYAAYITGSIARDGAGFRLEIRLQAPGRRRPLLESSLPSKSQEELLSAVHALAVLLRKAVGETDAVVASTPALTTRSLHAFHALVIALRHDLTGRPPLLHRTLAIDDGFVQAWSELAGAYRGLGQFREALPYSREACVRATRQDEPTRLLCEAAEHILRYEVEQALEKSRTCQALNPFLIDAPKNLAFLYQEFLHDPVCSEMPARTALRLGDIASADHLMSSLVVQGRAAEFPEVLELIGRWRGSDHAKALVQATALTVIGPKEELRKQLDYLEHQTGDLKSIGLSLRLLGHLASGRLSEARGVAAHLWRTTLNQSDFAYRHFAGLSIAWTDVLRGVPPSLLPDHCEPARNCLLFLPHLAALCADAGIGAPLAEALSIHTADLKDPRSRFVMEELAFARGCLGLAQGDATGALQVLAPLARDSTHLRRHRMAARAYERLERWSGAAQEYETALSQPCMKWGPDNPAVWVMDQYRLASVYDRLSDRDRARQWYTRFVADWSEGDTDLPALAAAKGRIESLGPASTSK